MHTLQQCSRQLGSLQLRPSVRFASWFALVVAGCASPVSETDPASEHGETERGDTAQGTLIASDLVNQNGPAVCPREANELCGCKGVVPAFPGAQGGGSAARGGRGGKVIEVTTLADSGSGSLRAALAQSGERMVVFRVSGTIELRSPLDITKPYVTVAGQTAPGGIVLSGERMDMQPLSIGTHDVVIRYLRIRTGRGNSYRRGVGDAISMGEGSDFHDVIIDHCSLSWGNDENVALWTDSGVARNFTISHSIISEALDHDGHSTGLIVGSNTMCEDMKNISVHHNLFAHNDNRNPYLKVASQEVVNNIVYNWGWLATQLAGGVDVDIIGNIYRSGVDDRGRSEVVWRSDRRSCNEGPPGSPSIYLKGNIGPHNSDPKADQWNSMMERAEAWAYPLPARRRATVNRSFERTSRLNLSRCPVTVDPVAQLESAMLDHVGASRRLTSDGSWAVARDSVDKRLISEYKNRSGRIILTEDDVGGFPNISSHTPYRDQDHDGMSDEWEKKHGFNPRNPLDRNGDRDNDGFNNLEEFLSGTRP